MRALAALSVTAGPALAEACPACSRQYDGPFFLILLGSMIFFPFLVARFAFKAIRAESQRAEEPGAQ